MLFGAMGAPPPLIAQEAFDGQPVNAIEFEGVEAMDRSELEEVIATEARSCRNLIYTPLCWITDSGTFEEKPRLDILELERDELRIRVRYWRAGFRFTEAEAVVREEDEGVQVVFRIQEGPPTLVSAVDVVQVDSILSPRELREARLPRAGAPLDLSVVDSAGIRIQAMLRARGYAGASVADTILLADAGNSARVRYAVVPGPLTTIESLEIAGNREVEDATIRRLVALEAGSLFRADELQEAQRSLYRSELFRQVILRTEPRSDSTMGVFLQVQEAPFRQIRLGGGLTTIDFVQLESRYTLYNWYGSARRLDLRGAVGNLLAPQLFGSRVFGSAAPFGIGDTVEDAFLRPTWELSADLSQPWLFSSRTAFSLGLFGRRLSVPGIVVDEGYGAGVTLTRQVARRTHVSLSYNYEITRVAAGDLYFCVNFGVCQDELIEALSGEQALSPLSLVARTDRTDDPLFPSRGWTGRLEMEHASTFTASDFRYNRATLELTGFLPLGPGTLAARVRGGWARGLGGTAAAVGVPGASGDLLHPRKRFYTGGSRSVRGYGENQLGPRILSIPPARLLEDDSMRAGCTGEALARGDCDPAGIPADEFQPRPLGGTSVLGGSLEYRLPLLTDLSAAFFVDAATVGDAGLDVPAGTRRAVTPGLGIRYRSPVGPIRLDLGIRPIRGERLPVITQVEDADGSFRLVQLDQQLFYDPVEQEGSTFRRLISRLQLHLSIGEAF
jgi:outer membrane protein assembly factor BamA